MTIEELKVEAEKLGYSVVPKAVSMGRRDTCTCGSRSLYTFGTGYGRYDKFYVYCRNCGKSGPCIEYGTYHRKDCCLAAAVKAWNEMIAKEKEETNA